MVDIGYKDLVYKVFVLDWWFLGEMFVDWLNKEVLVMLSVGLIWLDVVLGLRFFE